MREDYNRYTFEPKITDNGYEFMDILYYNPIYNSWDNTLLVYDIKYRYKIIPVNGNYELHVSNRDETKCPPEEIECICKAFKDQYGKELVVVKKEEV